MSPVTLTTGLSNAEGLTRGFRNRDAGNESVMQPVWEVRTMSSLSQLGRLFGFGILCGFLAVAGSAPAAAQGQAAAMLYHDCVQAWNKSKAKDHCTTPKITAHLEGYGVCQIETTCTFYKNTEDEFSENYNMHTKLENVDDLTTSCKGLLSIWDCD